MTQPGLVISNRDAIIKRVAEGEPIGKIAQSIGVDRRTIARHLASDPEYQDAVMSYHDSRLDEAESMLLDAATHEDVPSRAGRAAAARSYWSSVSWRAERLDRRYAAKQETSGQSITIVIAPTDSDGRIIDQE